MSDTCSLFPSFGDPWPCCLLPSHLLHKQPYEVDTCIISCLGLGSSNAYSGKRTWEQIVIWKMILEARSRSRMRQYLLVSYLLLQATGT